jgi:ABC-type Zn2+ transport system substrate-binding protein/surface adhesin
MACAARRWGHEYEHEHEHVDEHEYVADHDHDDDYDYVYERLRTSTRVWVAFVVPLEAARSVCSEGVKLGRSRDVHHTLRAM